MYPIDLKKFIIVIKNIVIKLIIKNKFKCSDFIKLIE